MNAVLIWCLISLLRPHVHRVLATECASIQEHFGANRRRLLTLILLRGSHNLE